VNLNPNPPKGGGDITVADGTALVPESGPAGTAADLLEVKPQSSQISVHVVKEGETLSQIAELYDVSVNTIRWANDISRSDIVHPGDELIILPVTGIRHTVAKGETLASIAKKYDADIEEVANYNVVAVDSDLAVGEQIIIPDGIIATAPAPKPASSSGSGYVPPVTTTVPASSAGFLNPLPGSVKTQGVHGYNGVDFGGVSAGSPVLAAADGSVVVVRSGGWNGGYGSYVVVQHDSGVQTLYAHLNSVSVGMGQRVNAGQQIGGVGSTGRSTGIHLHFEVRGAANPF
jgi:LysM repeat protein